MGTEEAAVSRLVRAERADEDVLLFIVAGTAGAVEIRIGQNYSYFTAHSVTRRPGFAHHNVAGERGIAKRGCHILEGHCWYAVVGAPPSYDFDDPTADDVPQWEALEELYRIQLEDQ
jgi:hypothetical protein